MITPSNKEITGSFKVFDNLVTSINSARRNARDYVTDIAVEKIQEEKNSLDWITSINMAHLHPNYGVLSPEDILAKENQEDDDGEVDLNYEAYKEKKMKGRQSPHPSLVIEVRSTPAPVIQEEGPKSNLAKEKKDDENVTKDDLKKLEALFGKSATFEDEQVKTGDEAFYEAIGKAQGIQQISFETPMSKSQSWIVENDSDFKDDTSSFAICDTKHVDSAYEFVFSNIAMHHSFASESTKGKQNYLIMPNFLSSSATSFEKFSMEVQSIVDAMPTLNNSLSVSTLHPEQIEKGKRSPHPVFVIQWIM